ncbi:MAG TPA: DUF2397 family protein, partial [Streptosporangiaceae bacterium]|nr:DUF2397 family protein [Streptosporangiaceae bacterium]
MDRAEEDETGRWPGAGTPGGLAVASYLTAPAGVAAQHWLIVDTLLDEQTRSLFGVSRPDLEVLLRHRLSARPGLPASAPADPPGSAPAARPGSALAYSSGSAPAAPPGPPSADPPDPPLAPVPLDRRLDQLVAWGVVVQWTGPSGDPVCQLTAAAAQLHQAVRRLGPAPASSALAAPDLAGTALIGDAPAGPDLAVASRLGASVAAGAAPPVLAAELARLTGATPGEPAVAAQAWSVLRTTLAAMTEAVAGWRAGLAAAQAGAADPARVAARQDPLRRDVDGWTTGVDRHSDTIAAHAARLLDAGPPAWRPAALHSLGAAVPEDRLSALL